MKKEVKITKDYSGTNNLWGKVESEREWVFLKSWENKEHPPKKSYLPSNGITLNNLKKKGFKVHISHIRYIKTHRNRIFPIPSSHKTFSSKFLAKGGTTSVTVKIPGGDSWEVVSFCSLEDNFNYKTGVKEALENLDPSILRDIH